MAGLSSDGIQLGPDWFWEDPQESMFGGEAYSLKVKEVIYHKKSKYQDILVFDRWVQKKNFIAFYILCIASEMKITVYIIQC